MAAFIHHAIVVSGRRTEVKVAQDQAKQLGLPCSEPVNALANDFATFLIAPDGGLEPGITSSKGKEARAAWIAWAAEQKLQWVHIRYGKEPAIEGSSYQADE